jgi:hypothetical protein
MKNLMNILTNNTSMMNYDYDNYDYDNDMFKRE